jgi:UDP-glucose 4-epimerase
LNLSGARVLVTGGAGFIGSHLTDRLLESGAYVTVYDNFDDFYGGKEVNLANASGNPRFRLIEGDVLDIESLARAIDGMDVVFHEAAQAGVAYSVEHPSKTNDVNVNGTLNVLSLARQFGVKRLVNASSSSIFGEPRYLPIDEKHPTNPTSTYGVSKLAAEQYASVFSRVYGTYVVSLRYFSVYGPRGRPDQVIRRFAKSISQGKPPVIQGDGSHSRDFTYVSDVVAATIKAAESEGLGGEVFNIGFGSRTSIGELAEKMIDLMGLSGKMVPRRVKGDAADFPHTRADNEKAKRLLKWEPKVALDQGLQLFLDWMERPTTLMGKMV